MTHGFDDQGRQYDKEGNLSDWWTAEDAKIFVDDDVEIGECVVARGTYLYATVSLSLIHL